MKTKTLGFVIGIIVICGLIFVVFNSSLLSVLQEPQQELDFNVSGANECLRFLTPTVETVYVPFRTGAGEQWQLTINCTQSPSAGAWTDVYLYRGYWDGGNDHKCISEDLYPIISKIEATDLQIKTNNTFTQTFGESTPQGYTVFFIFPPGGQTTYQVKLTQIK